MSYGEPLRELKTVSEAEEESQLMDGSGTQDSIATASSQASSSAERNDGTDSEEGEDHVFGEDYETRERVSTLINKLAQYRSPVHEGGDVEQGGEHDGEITRQQLNSTPEKTRKTSRPTERERVSVLFFPWTMTKKTLFDQSFVFLYRGKWER